MLGKEKYKPPKGFEKKIHVIGSTESPILKIEKGKVHTLFTDEFWTLFKIWEAYNAGMGLPEQSKIEEFDRVVYNEKPSSIFQKIKAILGFKFKTKVVSENKKYFVEKRMSWNDYDPLFIEIIINMERHHKNNFSLQAAYLKALSMRSA